MYMPARGGRSCEHFGGYKTINRIPFTFMSDYLQPAGVQGLSSSSSIVLLSGVVVVEYLSLAICRYAAPIRPAPQGKLVN